MESDASDHFIRTTFSNAYVFSGQGNVLLLIKKLMCQYIFENIVLNMISQNMKTAKINFQTKQLLVVLK